VVLYSAERGVARVRLARPEKRNALSLDMLEALDRALARAADDGAVGAVLLEAEGPAFCAGMDLRGVRLDDEDEAARFARTLAAVYRRLLTIEKPLLAGVDGLAAGGGVGLAAAADILWVGPGARFTLPEVRLGLVPALVSVVLGRRLSMKRVAGLALASATLDAAAALDLGLADRRADGSAAGAAEAEARRLIRESSSGALRRTKALLAGGPSAALLDQELARAESCFREAVAAADARRGLAAHRRGETPSWSDG
jgi:enoyl-CoA hydratase/carnithine racemase